MPAPLRASGLTAEVLVDNAMPKLPTISPDGRLVAYLVSEVGVGGARCTDLWFAPSDGSGAPTRLATGLARVTALSWAADGASLLFITQGELRRILLTTGESETLATHAGGVLDHLPFPDGQRLAVITGAEPDEAQARRVADGDDGFVWGEQVSSDRLWILHLRDRTWAPVEALERRHVCMAALRPDGEGDGGDDGGTLAVISWATALDEPGAFTARLHVVDVESGAALDLGPVGIDAHSLVWWSAAGAWHVSYVAEPSEPSEPSGQVGHVVFDVEVPDVSDVSNVPDVSGETGGLAKPHRDLTSHMPACPLQLVQLDHAPPLALFAEGLDTAVYRLDPTATDARFERILQRRGLLEMLTADSQGATIAVRASTGTAPVDIFAGPVHGPLVQLSDTQRATVDAVGEWGVQERLAYQAADGLTIEGLLVLPPGRSRSDGPFPLITLIHGGPYARHVDAASLLELPCPQWFAAAGYAVFLPNPRGSLGRGQQFAQRVIGALGQEEWTDILAGIDRLIADGVADPDRLGITGWSHGGYLAAWAVGQTDRFKAVIMGAGISDWSMQVGVGELGNQERVLAGSYGWESAGPHEHDRHSPISYASRVRTPVLLLHGEQDQNVPLGQALYFARALSHYQVENQLVVYPREGHGIWERAHQIDVLHRSVAWFDRWLGTP